MILLIITSVFMNCVLLYAAYNSIRKIEMLETTISNFYYKVSITLHAMRVIDERQMFERDDEVGEVFNQLTDVVNELRPLIYGSTLDGETNEKDIG